MHDHLLDSGALQTVNKVLGATGGQQHTHIDAGNLQLALDANDFVRRGRTLALSEGIFAARITNTHAAAGAVSTTVNPYAIAAQAAGYPTPMPEGFDVWLLSCWASIATGVGSATLASRVSIVHPATAVAFGAAGSVGQIVRLMLGEQLISAAVAYMKEQGSNVACYTGPAWRIPRGASLVWASQAAIAGDMILELELGVFPSGLGQDAVGAG